TATARNRVRRGLGASVRSQIGIGTTGTTRRPPLSLMGTWIPASQRLQRGLVCPRDSSDRSAKRSTEGSSDGTTEEEPQGTKRSAGTSTRETTYGPWA